jgi:putative transposase
MGVMIVKGVLARDHVHMFLSVPPKYSVSDVIRRLKGRSSRRLQQEFPALKKRYWGRHFWARGYFFFARRAATSRTNSYFSTLRSTGPMLPTSVGSGSLTLIAMG